ncbi:hypothetical protein GWI33_006709 [Rhynchophorus ferrugineus]|uniref:Uncharacterized protein n=1 Tax=Rhynchophorus ferrugineus TaxID=354439 RepID=A0A834IYN6_RHYFE|nr:hypothetical protein GWI33_006709 [Rhynchophorus ferrugineus]
MIYDDPLDQSGSSGFFISSAGGVVTTFRAMSGLRSFWRQGDEIFRQLNKNPLSIARILLDWGNVDVDVENKIGPWFLFHDLSSERCLKRYLRRSKGIN